MTLFKISVESCKFNFSTMKKTIKNPGAVPPIKGLKPEQTNMEIEARNDAIRHMIDSGELTIEEIKELKDEFTSLETCSKTLKTITDQVRRIQEQTQISEEIIQSITMLMQHQSKPLKFSDIKYAVELTETPLSNNDKIEYLTKVSKEYESLLNQLHDSSESEYKLMRVLWGGDKKIHEMAEIRVKKGIQNEEEK